MKNILIILIFSPLFNFAQQLNNGGFEKGLSSWSIIEGDNGNPMVLDSFVKDSIKIYPIEGKKFLQISHEKGKFEYIVISNTMTVNSIAINNYRLSYISSFNSKNSEATFKDRQIYYANGKKYVREYLNGNKPTNNYKLFGKTIELDLRQLNIPDPIDSIEFQFVVNNVNDSSFSLFLDDVKYEVLSASINNTLTNDLNVYPNPTYGVINIEGNQQYTFNVFDAKGNCLKANANLEDNVIDISMLSDGLYFLELTDDQGQVIRKKIIKN
jgi:hypothetical protein